MLADVWSCDKVDVVPVACVLACDCVAAIPNLAGGLAMYPGGVLAALAPVEYMVRGEYGHGMSGGT